MGLDCEPQKSIHQGVIDVLKVYNGLFDPEARYSLYVSLGFFTSN